MSERAGGKPPRLRAEIRIRRHDDGDGPDARFVLEDPLRNRFYLVGAREQAFIEALRTSEPAAALVAANHALTPQPELLEDDAKAMLAWLAREELLVNVELPAVARPFSLTAMHKLAQRANLITVRVPLGNPDRLLDRLAPVLGWLVAPWFAPLWLMLVLSGAYQLASASASLWLSVANLAHPATWPGLVVVWVVMKVVHEFFHGLACKRHGVQVSEVGVFMILLFPVGYVDATRAWRLSSRWQRAHIAVAGMYAELMLAAVAAWVFAHTTDPLMRSLAFNAVLIGGVSTLVINANPLMRFDGYFAFSDVIDEPNLQQRGLAFTRSLLHRVLFGLPALASIQNSARFLVKLHGVAAWLWRIGVVMALLVSSAQLLGGIGTAVAVLASIPMLLFPLAAFFRGAWLRMGEEGRLLRGAFQAITVTGAVLVLFAGIETQPSLSAPAIVDYPPGSVLRAPAEATVAQVLVRDGQAVEADEPVLILDDPQLRVKRLALAVQSERVEGQLRQALDAERTASYQVLLTRQRVLKQQQAEVDERLTALTVKASIGGTVVAHRIHELEGRRVRHGDVLAHVVNEATKEVAVSVLAEDWNRVALESGESVELALDAHPMQWMRVSLSDLEPRARRDVRVPAFATINGGPLPVERTTGNAGGREARYLYLSPRVRLTARPTAEVASLLRAGETGWVRLPLDHEPVVARVGRAIARRYDQLAREARSHWSAL